MTVITLLAFYHLRFYIKMHHTASCCEFNFEVTVAQEVEQVTNGTLDCMARDWAQRSCSPMCSLYE